MMMTTISIMFLPLVSYSFELYISRPWSRGKSSSGFGYIPGQELKAVVFSVVPASRFPGAHLLLGQNICSPEQKKPGLAFLIGVGGASEEERKRYSLSICREHLFGNSLHPRRMLGLETPTILWHPMTPYDSLAPSDSCIALHGNHFVVVPALCPENYKSIHRLHRSGDHWIQDYEKKQLESLISHPF